MSTWRSETLITQRRNHIDLLEESVEDGTSGSAPVTEGETPRPTDPSAAPKPATSTQNVTWRAAVRARCLPSRCRPLPLNFHALLCTTLAFIANISAYRASKSTPGYSGEVTSEASRTSSQTGTGDDMTFSFVAAGAFCEVVAILIIVEDLAVAKDKFRHLKFYRRLLRICCFFFNLTGALAIAVVFESVLVAVTFYGRPGGIFVLHVFAIQFLLSAGILVRLDRVVTPITNARLRKRHFTSATTHAQDKNRSSRSSSPIPAV